MTGRYESRNIAKRLEMRAWRMLRNHAAVALAILCVAVATKTRANDNSVSDSGWLTSSPTLGPAIEQPKSHDSQMFNHLLLDGDLVVSPPPAKTVKPAAREPIQTARRPDSKRGWRPPRLVNPAIEDRDKQEANHVLNTPIRDDLDYDEAVNTPDEAEMAADEPADVQSPKPAPSTLTPLAPPPTPLKPTLTISTKVDRKIIPEDAYDDVQESDESRSTPFKPEAESRPLRPLTRSQVQLRNKVRRVLSAYYKRALNSKDHDPWEAMHGLLAYGPNSRILQGGTTGKPITMVGWLCYNKPCKAQTMLYVNPDGELRVKVGVGLQGHEGQLLAMLAQSRVSPDYPIRVKNHQFTVNDLIEAEKNTCYPKTELTFKLIALGYYLDSDASWVNDQGASWDIPRLIREELAQPIRGAACGGTHRLSGLSLAVKNRIARGEPVDGDYALAADYVEKYHQYAFRLQNSDGSLSTSWFKGRGSEDDIDRRIKTTGHTLEWLVYSLDDEELDNPRTVRTVNYLANLMLTNYDHAWEVGPLCHAIHSLLLYDQRVFQPHDGPERVASRVYRINGPVNRHNPSKSFWDWGR